MQTGQWTTVDEYINSHFGAVDAVLEAALHDSAAAGLPEIQVAANQGKLLHMLARTVGARRILEFGTLGGYSTIWLARALAADGRLISLEFAAKHAEVARRNIARAGLESRVEVRVGAALDLLPAIASERFTPLDFTFIDADKENTAGYFDWAVSHSRPGALVIVDNVIRHGDVIDERSTDPRVIGMRRFFEAASRDSRVTITALQTVGSKGYDGLAIAVVNG